ncbi:hypothetical protein QCA50_020897 [Cerrena zonata]|uniref:Cytochrome P450 n=1 Tax=Cerrena zonata TaxID=2478898 RepID=A0AAW0F8S4_9APHY
MSTETLYLTSSNVALPYFLARVAIPINSASILLATISFLLGVAVYRLYFSPLAAIPGPWYAAVSDLWLNTWIARLEQHRTIQALFEQYGPVVRIGPNKVAFCDVTTARSVYAIHKFDKSNLYKSLLTNDNDHAMTSLSHSEHAIRRKAFAPHYAVSNLTLFQSEIQNFAGKLTETLDRTSGKTSVECLELFRHFLVDAMSSTVFGFRSGALEAWTMNVTHPVVGSIHDFPVRGILRSVVPSFLWKSFCRIPNSRLRRICDSDKTLAEFVGERLYDVRSGLHSGALPSEGLDNEKMPLMHRLLRHRLVSTGELVPDHHVISECMGHMIAGVDTSSTLLSYLFWELSRRSDIMIKLQAELDEVMTDSKIIPDISVLNELPFLNAFLKEGLRVYGSAPAFLERVVPARTSATVSKADEDFDLMGYALPPGTIVGTQAWSMHRNADVFPSAETFLPERWLSTDGSDAEEDRLMKMSQHLMPFGLGTRVCGGQNLARMMLKITLATTVRNFDIIANSAETNERTMKIMDAFVSQPLARECRLSFLTRSH